MSKPFAITLTYTYLCELGIDSDAALDLAEFHVQDINMFLDKAVDYLRNRLAMTDSNNHVQDAKYRRGIYDSICTSFFGYGYARYWVFKPVYSNPFADNINTNIFEGGPSFSEYITNLFPKQLMGRFDSDYLAHLDIQTMQYIYTYCFENGANFRFY